MRETNYHLQAPIHLSIALLDDLHNGPYQSIIDSLTVHRPDMICIAGDLIYSITPTEDTPVVQIESNVLPFLVACRKLAPTFVSLGNHEWMLSDTDFQLIRSTGVTLLDNNWCVWNGLVIGGLSSARVTEYQIYRSGKEGRFPKLEATDHQRFHSDTEGCYTKSEYARSSVPIEPEIAWMDTFEQQQGYHILLSHHPEYWEPYLMNRRIDLVLSGHAHGGQIRLFGHGLYAPGQGCWPKYTHGVHTGVFGTMIISAGLSNTGGIIPRLFNPREIIYIMLEI